MTRFGRGRLFWLRIKVAAIDWPFEFALAWSMILSTVFSLVFFAVPSRLILQALGPAAATAWAFAALVVAVVLLLSLLYDDLNGTVVGLSCAGALIVAYLLVALISPVIALSVLGFSMQVVGAFTSLSRAWYLHSMRDAPLLRREGGGGGL